jgi:phage baseplate assembly protein gpV
MKKIIFALLGVIALSPAIAQYKVVNDPNAEVRTAKDFHAIKVSTGIRLYLTQGNEEAVAVSAAKTEDRDRIVTSVEHGVLKIYYDNGKWGFHNDNNRELKAYVSCKVLDALNASSGAHVSVDGTIKSGNLELDFSSGAEFKGEVAASDLKVEQSSGSVSTISGATGSLSAGASSGSAINAFDLRSDACEARASSGANVDVSVNKTLTASASSGGQINYKGSGVISTVHTSSGGSVSKR